LSGVCSKCSIGVRKGVGEVLLAGVEIKISASMLLMNVGRLGIGEGMTYSTASETVKSDDSSETFKRAK
jgi:hypothetical protein